MKRKPHQGGKWETKNYKPLKFKQKEYEMKNKVSLIALCLLFSLLVFANVQAYFDDFSSNTTSDYETSYWPFSTSQGATVSIVYDAPNQRAILQGVGGYGWILMKLKNVDPIPPLQDFEFSYDMAILNEYNGAIYLGDGNDMQFGKWMKFGINSYSGSLYLDTYQGEIAASPTTSTSGNLKVTRTNGSYAFYCDGTLFGQLSTDIFNNVPLYYGPLTAISSGESGVKTEIAVDNWNFPELEVPESPEPMSPGNGSTVNTTTPTLEVQSISGVDQYNFQVYEGGSLKRNWSGNSNSWVVDPALTDNRSYIWHCRAHNSAGWSEYFYPKWTFKVQTVGVLEENDINMTPGASLVYNLPNPFKFQTVIYYSLPKATQVDLRIFDATGRVVKTLVTGKQESGCHETFWDGKDFSQIRLPSGVYFYRLKSDEFTVTKKMLKLE